MSPSRKKERDLSRKANNRGKTRKFHAQERENISKPLTPPPKIAECIKDWLENEKDGDQLLLSVTKEERHFVKQDLFDFFKHYARIKWLIENNGFEGSDHRYLFGCFMVLLRGQDDL